MTVQARRDINVQANNIVADQDAALNAAGNITITSAQETSREEHLRQEKKTGIFASGVGFTIGSESQKTTTDGQTVTQAGATIGSTGANVTITAGKDAQIKASDVIAGKNIDITAQNVSIQAGENKEQTIQTYEYKKSGLSVSVSSPAIDAVTTAVGYAQKAKGAQDERLSALYAIKAGQSLEGIKGKVQDPVNGVPQKAEEGKKAPANRSDITVSGSLNALGKIFDKKTVQEKQELAGLFGELAYNEVHKLSQKNGWKEGSSQKVALHALVGGIMAQLAGGSFGSGAVGAGVNELIQNELSKIKDPALYQWASALVGSVASQVTGCDGLTGASTAVSGTRNNLYWEYVNKEAALRAANVSPEKAEEIMDAFNADPLNSYNLGKDAEYKNVEELNIGVEGDVNRLNLFVNIARDKGLNEEQISSLVNTFNEQLNAGVQAHNAHIIDAGMNLAAGAVGAVEIYATVEAGKLVYQLRNIDVNTTQVVVTDTEIAAIQSSQTARMANSASYQELKQTAEFLKNSGLNTERRRGVIEAFNPGAQVITLEQDVVVYRYYGGQANPRGNWVTTQPLTDPVNQLALPPGSTAENVTTWVIPRGTPVLQGTVAPNFGKTGGANQIYLPDMNVLIQQ